MHEDAALPLNSRICIGEPRSLLKVFGLCRSPLAEATPRDEATLRFPFSHFHCSSFAAQAAVDRGMKVAVFDPRTFSLKWAVRQPFSGCSCFHPVCWDHSCGNRLLLAPSAGHFRYIRQHCGDRYAAHGVGQVEPW